MHRPEFPQGCVLPVACIRAIRAEQECYDRDPEAYERRLREREEERLMEAMELEAERIRELQEETIRQGQLEAECDEFEYRMEEGAYYEDEEPK